MKNSVTVANMSFTNDNYDKVMSECKRYEGRNIFSYLKYFDKLSEAYDVYSFKSHMRLAWTYRNTDNMKAFVLLSSTQLQGYRFQNELFVQTTPQVEAYLRTVGFVKIYKNFFDHVLDDKDDLNKLYDFQNVYLHPTLNIVLRLVNEKALANVKFASYVVSNLPEALREDETEARAVFHSAFYAKVIEDENPKLFGEEVQF